MEDCSSPRDGDADIIPENQGFWTTGKQSSAQRRLVKAVEITGEYGIRVERKTLLSVAFHAHQKCTGRKGTNPLTARAPI